MEDEETHDLLVIQKTIEQEEQTKSYNNRTKMLWFVYIVFTLTEAYVIKLILDQSMTVGNMIGLQAIHILLFLLLAKTLHTYRKIMYDYNTTLNEQLLRDLKGQEDG